MCFKTLLTLNCKTQYCPPPHPSSVTCRQSKPGTDFISDLDKPKNSYIKSGLYNILEGGGVKLCKIKS